MATIDVVLPLFNEQDCIEENLSRLQKVAESHPEHLLRFIFVNDGSSDNTFFKLTHASKKLSNAILVNLSRNFGHQMAVTAGLSHCQSDYIVILDGDLQDPPELIVPMVEKLQSGFDVVYGERIGRKGESGFKKLTAVLFYQLISFLCRVNIPKNTGDFRAISRKVLFAFSQMPERHRFIRGMIPWVGFKSVAFPYVREERFAGKTKFSFSKMFRFALDAIFSFSNFPLRLSTYLGLFLTAIGTGGAILVLFLRLFTAFTVPGISAVLFCMFIIAGLQSVMLGISGEYIGRIFEEVKRRPLFLIDGVFDLQTGAEISYKDKD